MTFWRVWFFFIITTWDCLTMSLIFCVDKRTRNFLLLGSFNQITDVIIITSIIIILTSGIILNGVLFIQGIFANIIIINFNIASRFILLTILTFQNWCVRLCSAKVVNCWICLFHRTKRSFLNERFFFINWHLSKFCIIIIVWLASSISFILS